MSMQDPISDMLTRVRNAQMAMKRMVTMPSSKTKLAIANVLQKAGYILAYEVSEDVKKPELTIELKYFQGKPVIEKIKRISRPGIRIYKSKNELPQVLAGLGIAVVSTSKGVMTAGEARQLGLGGEILCEVV